MRIRSSVVIAVKLLAIGAIAGTTACGTGGAGRIMADTPALPYQAPEIDEITGIDSTLESSDGEGSSAGSGSAQNQQK